VELAGHLTELVQLLELLILVVAVAAVLLLLVVRQAGLALLLFVGLHHNKHQLPQQEALK
jgi:hypothetical protein